MTEREEFEAWLSQQGFSHKRYGEDSVAWLAWQEAKRRERHKQMEKFLADTDTETVR